MYKKVTLISEDNLFHENHTINFDNKSLIVMVECKNLFEKFKFHKHRLILIISSMRNQAKYFMEKNLPIKYLKLEEKIELKDYISRVDFLLKEFKDLNEMTIYESESIDFQSKIELYCKNNNLKLNIINSPGFLTSKEDFKFYMGGKKTVLMNNFYIYQRKKLNILIDKDKNPIGGSWSYDKENRKKLPKNIQIPKLPQINLDKTTKEVCALVDKEFPDGYGNSENFFYPTTRDQALMWLEDFLINKFNNFGPYEDAISSKHEFNFHSILSPLINIGLLTPKEVVDKSLEYYNENDDVSLASIEGFIRQIIGWRESIRGFYHNLDFHKNYFNFTNRINKTWYDATTGIIPLDNCIKNVMKNSYLHHIERLMIVGNLMLLCRIHPDDVYNWFMELFIDSSEWVMAPNVYGMSQFADGGSFATKPYICSSNYILKMSDYKKAEWCETWDGLYWLFINDNKELFKSNHRMSMMIKLLDNIDLERKNRIFKLARDFILSVTK